MVHHFVFMAVVASVFGPSECLNSTEPSVNGSWLQPGDNTTDWSIFSDFQASTVIDMPPNTTVLDTQEPRVSMSTETVSFVSGTMATTISPPSGTSRNLSTAWASSTSNGTARSSASEPNSTSMTSSQPTPSSMTHPTSITPTATPTALSSSPRTGALNSLLSTLLSSQSSRGISTWLPAAASTTAGSASQDTTAPKTASTQGAGLGPPVVVTNRILSRTSSITMATQRSDVTTRHSTPVPTEKTFKDPRADQVMTTGEKLTTGMLAGIGVLALLCIGLGVCALSAKSNERITKVQPIGGNKTLVSNENGGVVAIT
ncbi:uncharacterized protein [Branchiostoma lanceolatum]|uniref:uncharacterized protein n=1 Tax=Branchiostoma lanceolatum TaxID=7740 RepID=UPI003455B86D